MDKNPIDAEFKFVAHPFRLQIGDVLWYVFWIGGYAAAAYAVNDRVASAVFVCAAGLAWPVRRFLGSLRHEVSKEQGDWLMEKARNGGRVAKPRAHQRHVTYDPGVGL